MHVIQRRTGRRQGVQELHQEELNNRWQDAPPWLVATVVIVIGRSILVVAFSEPQDGWNVPHCTSLGEEQSHFHDQTSAANAAATALDIDAFEPANYAGHLAGASNAMGKLPLLAVTIINRPPGASPLNMPSTMGNIAKDTT
jgi:hypothetical protein